MTSLKSVDNLWDVPPQSCSNAMKATIYVERAKLVLDELYEHRSPGASHLTRKELARRIGCRPSALTQNAKLNAIVREIKLLQSTQDDSVGLLSTIQSAIRRLPMPELPGRRIPVDSSRSWLLFTDRTCLLEDSPAPGIPAIAFCDGIDEASADWFRALALREEVGVGSLDTYADTLRPFLCFCRERSVSLSGVDDRLLIRWRRHQRLVLKLSKRRIDESTRVIFKYLLWCDETGRLKDHVARYEPGELPDRLRGYAFPVSASRVKVGYGRLVWVSPLTSRSKGSSVGNRSTPTDEDIESLHRRALKAEYGMRNSTMISVAHDTGGRRVEILQMTISQLPSAYQLDELIRRNEDWPITVIRKGGDEGILKLSVDCLLKINRFVRVRKAWVEERKGRHPGYKEPDEIFLSDRGGVLKPDSVTALMKDLFKAIGVKNANIHRIRAKYAVEWVEIILDAYLEEGIEFSPGSSWVDTVLTRVAAKMGHKNPSSLKHYLDYVLERRLRTSEADLRRRLSHVEHESRVATIELIERHRRLLRGLSAELTHDSPDELVACIKSFAAELTSERELVE